MVTIKHVDLTVDDFNEDSLYEGPITISLQFLGFTKIVSEPIHIRGDCLDQIYIRKNRNSFSNFHMERVVAFTFLTMILLFYTLKLDFNYFMKILLNTIFSYKNTVKLINSFCFQSILTITSTNQNIYSKYILRFTGIMD